MDLSRCSRQGTALAVQWVQQSVASASRLESSNQRFSVSSIEVSPTFLEFDSSLLANQAPVGGRLQFFLPNWKLITADAWVLSTVSGYNIEFSDIPVQQVPPKPFRFGSLEAELLEVEVQEMLAKDAIECVPEADRAHAFVSQLFLRPKKDGGWRPVFNLRSLNSFVLYEHFKMEGLFMLKGLVTRGAFLAKIDLKDAYFSIPIAAHHRRFLSFEWNGTLYCFKVLCFGLASAPRVFTKVLKPLLALLCKQGIHIIVFLDDILIINDTAVGLEKDVAFCVTLLQLLGFVINFKKSALKPVQCLVFLGLTLDTMSLKLFVPTDKIADIMAQGKLLLAANLVSLRDLSKFVGKVNAVRMALLPSPLFCRHLQQALIQGLAQFATYDAFVHLSDPARQELRSWLSEVWRWNGRDIFPPQPQLTLASDASLTGWGVVAHDGRTVSGWWSPTEASHSINYLELLASFLAIKSFAPGDQPCHVQIQSDNRTTVAYLNRLGGT